MLPILVLFVVPFGIFIGKMENDVFPTKGTVLVGMMSSVISSPTNFVSVRLLHTWLAILLVLLYDLLGLTYLLPENLWPDRLRLYTDRFPNRDPYRLLYAGI